MDIWAVAFGVVALLVGVGFALLGLTPPEYKASRFCLWLAAIWLGGTAFMSIIQSDQPPGRRMLIGAVVGATIGILLPEALRMITRREAASLSQLASKAPSAKSPEEVPSAPTISLPMRTSPERNNAPSQANLPASEPIVPDAAVTGPVSALQGPVREKVKAVGSTSPQRGSPALQPANEVTPSVAITASPAIIRAGESSRLSWSSANASSVLIMPNIGFVDPNGSMDVSPNQTTPFVIAAVTETGSLEIDNARVEVLSEAGQQNRANSDAGEAMVTGSIIATSDTMIANKPSLLRWNSFDATSVAILPTIGLVGGAGEIAVFPRETTAFTLLLWNATGSFGRASATVRVYRWPKNEPK